MQPDFDFRIRNMKKALLDVILPAVDPGNRAAVEQLHLVVGTLGLFQQQIDYAHWFEVTDGAALITMASELSAAAGQPLGESVHQALAAVNTISIRHDVTLSAIRAANTQLREAIAGALDLVLATADEAVVRSVTSRAVQLAGEQTARERAFVAATGFDVFPDSLQPLEEVLRA